MSQTNRLLSREKVNLCFITSDPSSNNGKTSNLHMVRSHAGKWRWSETRKKKGHMSRDKASLRTNYAEGHISEGYDTSDTSISDTSFGTSLSGSKDSSPDVDLGVLFEALEEKVNGIEVPGVFPPEETESFDSTDFCGSEMSGYPTAGCVNLYGIAPNILDPFQQYPHTSPLPSDLVSDANRYSLSVLWPGLLPPSFRASHPGVNAWLENSATHEALHSTLLFGSYSHRRTLWLVKNRGHFSNEDGKKLSLCEADAIVRVNRAIQSPSGAVTDCIILCVLCMATNKVDGPMWDQNQERIFQAPLTSLQWLDIYGRLSPHPVHQAGLVQLVRLRGGLEKIELPGLAAIIS
ncbi:hypothetical protein N7450_008760 [Penicillium hetheringtonii]|uniref:Uncharacterized protein n=1 Tax=Penicillium hetheringtonii TaxID=911720 RepID=A0AAD6GPN0_9EURO|nr:hypothetical protein N7450_008760 [Penicillium hetheringtonii]